jgi:hypothetical protein
MPRGPRWGLKEDGLYVVGTSSLAPRPSSSRPSARLISRHRPFLLLAAGRAVLLPGALQGRPVRRLCGSWRFRIRLLLQGSTLSTCDSAFLLRCSTSLWIVVSARSTITPAAPDQPSPSAYPPPTSPPTIAIVRSASIGLDVGLRRRSRMADSTERYAGETGYGSALGRNFNRIDEGIDEAVH